MARLFSGIPVFAGTDTFSHERMFQVRNAYCLGITALYGMRPVISTKRVKSNPLLFLFIAREKKRITFY